jgi:anti-sigma factor ChrR (cupin superfamily)
MTLPAEHFVWRDFLDIDPDDPGLAWQRFHQGIDILPINGTPDGCFCALLRYYPGAVVPHHQHSGHEHILILRGAQSDERGVYEEGTFLINMPDSSHRVVSDAGCLVLAIWESPVRFL